MDQEIFVKMLLCNNWKLLFLVSLSYWGQNCLIQKWMLVFPDQENDLFLGHILRYGPFVFPIALKTQSFQYNLNAPMFPVSDWSAKWTVSKRKSWKKRNKRTTLYKNSKLKEQFFRYGLQGRPNVIVTIFRSVGVNAALLQFLKYVCKISIVSVVVLIWIAFWQP